MIAIKYKVYFNHWFSQASDIIKLMREQIAGENILIELIVIGSHKTDNPSYKKDCDIFIKEPDGIQNNPEEYCSYCLSVCKEHNVNLFMPYKHLDIITKNIKDFKGIKVGTIDDYEMFNCLNNKIKTYELLKNSLPDIIPEYTLINENTDLGKYKNQMCIKKVVDIGGKSFRLLVKEYSHNLEHYIKPEISIEDTYKEIKNQDLILMPYIDKTEVSVDCLVTESQNIIVARYKINKTTEEIEILKQGNLYDRVIKLANVLNLRNIVFNVQFRGKYLLEVNTRMAGGVAKDSLIGVNFPRLLLLDVLHMQPPKFYCSNKIQINKITQWKIDT